MYQTCNIPDFNESDKETCGIFQDDDTYLEVTETYYTLVVADSEIQEEMEQVPYVVTVDGKGIIEFNDFEYKESTSGGLNSATYSDVLLTGLYFEDGKLYMSVGEIGNSYLLIFQKK